MVLNQGYYICRLCGYMHKGKEGPKICLACGAPATSFVPYKNGAEERRVKILSFDIHPILTHFGVGMSVLLAITLVFNFINPNSGGINFGFGGVLDFFVLALPFVVALTAFAGVIDGKMRYKKLNTPYLRRKIYYGISMVVCSILVLLFHLTSQNGTITALFVLESVFAFLNLGCAMLLGNIGKELTANIVPRGRELPIEKKSE